MSDQLANGPSPVARGRTYLPGRVRAAGAAGCCMLAMAGAAWVLWPREAREPKLTATPTSSWGVGQTLPERPFRVPAPPPTPAAFRPSATPPAAAARVIAAPPPQTRAMGFWEDAAASQQAAQQVAARASASVSTGRSKANGGDDPDVATPNRSELSQRMQTTHFADAAPQPHRFHVQYTIKKGTIFPCTPAQPISSALPGPVQCTTDDNVWSMDGSTILLPRGTQVNGTIERGLSNGDQRLFLVWTDALTPRPDLLSIPLDAPAADEMGVTGVPGDIDDHLWKKVKAALLVSMIDITSSAATGLAQRGNGNLNLNLGGVGGQAQSLGQTALQHDINIPATLYRGPGQPLSVYVPKYIDLAAFYRNVPRH